MIKWLTRLLHRHDWRALAYVTGKHGSRWLVSECARSGCMAIMTQYVSP